MPEQRQLTDEEIFARCEKDGALKVEEDLRLHKILPWETKAVTHWLQLSQSKREARADEREEESLLISKRALDISEKARSDARSAKIIAMMAMILSTIWAVASIIIQFMTKP